MSELTASPVTSVPLKIATALAGIVCGIALKAESGANEIALGAAEVAEFDDTTEVGTKADASGAHPDALTLLLPGARNEGASAKLADVFATAEVVEEGDAGTGSAESGNAEERAAEDGNGETGCGAKVDAVVLAAAPDAPAEVAEGGGASGGARAAAGTREDAGTAAATRTAMGDGTCRTILAAMLARFGASWGAGAAE